MSIQKFYESHSPRTISNNWVAVSTTRNADGGYAFWCAGEQALTPDIDSATRYRQDAVNEAKDATHNGETLRWLNVPLYECGKGWPELMEALELWAKENDLKPTPDDDMLPALHDTLNRAQRLWLKQYIFQWLS